METHLTKLLDKALIPYKKYKKMYKIEKKSRTEFKGIITNYSELNKHFKGLVSCSDLNLNKN